MFDATEDEGAARWFEAIVQRTRDLDTAYVRQVQKSTIYCLRTAMPPDVDAQIADALPGSVRALWLEDQISGPVRSCTTAEEFISCVRPFVKDHHAEAVIEEDVLAVLETFFTQWPRALECARLYVPADLVPAPFADDTG